MAIFQYQARSEPLGPIHKLSWLPTYPNPPIVLRNIALVVAGMVAPVATSAETVTADRTPAVYPQPSRIVRYASGSEVHPVSTDQEAVTSDRTPPTYPQPSRIIRYASGGYAAPVSTSPETVSADRAQTTYPQPSRVQQYAQGSSVLVQVVVAVPSVNLFAPTFPNPVSTIVRWAVTLSGSVQPVTVPSSPTTSPDLLDALWGLCDGTSALTTAFGRSGWLWLGEGPEAEPLPYAVIFDPLATEDIDYQSVNAQGQIPYDGTGQLQINVFATTRPAVKTLAKAIALAVNDAESSIVFDDGSLIHIRAYTLSEFLDPDKGPGGTDVWVRPILIDTKVSRTL